MDREQDLRAFVRWGEAREDVRAMIMTSSLTVPSGPVDVLSDYDIILIVRDIRPYAADRGWMGDFGPVLAAYGDPILTEGSFERSGYVTQYENGLKIDFTLWPVGLMQQIAAGPALTDEFDAGYRVLLDKDGLAAELKPPSYRAHIPTPPDEAKYLEKIELFFLDAVYVAKYLWRDDMVAAKHILDHFIKQDYVIPMLEWHFEIEHGWSIKPGPFGRRLKRSLRPDLWEELEGTYCGMRIAENWEALVRTIGLMRRASVEVGTALGFAYPDDLHQRAMVVIEKIKTLDHDASEFRWS